MDAKIESGIRTARNAAIAAAILNVVAMPLMAPSDIISSLHIIGAVLFLVCACGIARESRFCAMAAFFLSIAVAVYPLPTVISVIRYTNPRAVLSSPPLCAYLAILAAFSVIAVLLYRGIWATIVYHDRRERAETTSELETAESSGPSGDDRQVRT